MWLSSMVKSCTLKIISLPLSPKIRTVKLTKLIILTPNFWGAGGRGVRGKSLARYRRLKVSFAKTGMQFSLQECGLLLTPHPPLLVNSDEA